MWGRNRVWAHWADRHLHLPGATAGYAVELARQLAQLHAVRPNLYQLSGRVRVVLQERLQLREHQLKAAPDEVEVDRQGDHRRLMPSGILTLTLTGHAGRLWSTGHGRLMLSGTTLEHAGRLWSTGHEHHADSIVTALLDRSDLGYSYIAKKVQPLAKKRFPASASWVSGVGWCCACRCCEAVRCDPWGGNVRKGWQGGVPREIEVIFIYVHRI
jgi:hypothetical protein